jgi:dihydroorotase-like cyclic amidohydrolase
MTSAYRTRTRQQRASPSPPPGLPGLDLLLPLLLGAVNKARLSLERLVETCCEGPARTLGLRGEGRIEVGADAHLIIFSEGDRGRLRFPPPLSGLSWSPCIGGDLGGPPEGGLVASRMVARRGQLAPDTPAAQLLRHNRS